MCPLPCPGHQTIARWKIAMQKKYEEQSEKNAPNVWFSGTKNMGRKFDFLFYMSLWL
jgi:hypothetical protein